MPRTKKTPDWYYQQSIQGMSQSTVHAIITARLEADVLLFQYLGLVNENGVPLLQPSATEIGGAAARVEELLDLAQQRLYIHGVREIEVWIPFLRFLETVATGLRAPHSERYPKGLRARYKEYLRTLLVAPLPRLAKKESSRPSDFLEKYVDVRARVAALELESKRGELDSFPAGNVPRFFPTLTSDLIQRLAARDDRLWRRQGRRLRGAQLAVEILAHELTADPHTVRDWLKESKVLHDVAVAWGHAKPLDALVEQQAESLLADPTNHSSPAT